MAAASSSSISPPEWDMLLSAAQKNLPDRIRTMITQQGVPPSHANHVGQTALHIACLWGHLPSVKTLLELGANPNAANYLTGATPLIMTVQSHKISIVQKTDIVEALLQSGADVSQTDNMQQLPLDICDKVAVAPDHPLRSLLAPQAPPLWQAMEAGNVTQVRSLLNSDPSASQKAYHSQAPLSKAVQLIVAQVESATDARPLGEDDATISTTLDALAQIVDALLAAAPESEASPPPQRPMDPSEEIDDPPLVVILRTVRQQLMSQHPVPAAVTRVVQALEKAGATDLHHQSTTVDQEMLVGPFWCDAARRGHVSILEYLQNNLPRHFSNVNVTNRQGMTALHFSARSGQVAVVKWLLSQPDLDVNAADTRGNTARQAALVNNRDAVVRLLDEAGASAS